MTDLLAKESLQEIAYRLRLRLLDDIKGEVIPIRQDSTVSEFRPKLTGTIVGTMGAGDIYRDGKYVGAINSEDDIGDDWIVVTGAETSFSVGEYIYQGATAHIREYLVGIIGGPASPSATVDHPPILEDSEVVQGYDVLPPYTTLTKDVDYTINYTTGVVSLINQPNGYYFITYKEDTHAGITIDSMEHNYPTNTLWLEFEKHLHSCIRAAIRDVTRHTPDHKTYEVTLVDRTITGESLTRLGSSAYLIANYTDYCPVRKFSETIYIGDTTLTRGTHYTIDYAEGRITFINLDGFDLPATPTINYKTDNYAVDLRPLFEKAIGSDSIHTFAKLVDPVRITNIEYPLGATPKKFIPFDIWSHLLFPHWPEGRGTSSTKKHLIIHYEAAHRLPYWPDGQDEDPNDWQHFPSSPTTNLAQEVINALTQETQYSIITYDLHSHTDLLGFGYHSRAVAQAINDVAMRTPLQITKDYILDLTITDEEFIYDPTDLVYNDTGLFHQLNHSMEPFTEEVWSGAGKTGTKYKRGYDYEMDYRNGRVGIWGNNNATNTTRMTVYVTYYISYKKNFRMLDISDLYNVKVGHQYVDGKFETVDMIRPVMVEYPVDQRPRKYIPFMAWKDKLLLGSKFQDKKIIRVYYEADYSLIPTGG